MFRKLSLVAVAVPSPSAAALAGADVGFCLGLERRTSVSAWGWNGGWHRGGGPQADVGGPVSCGCASVFYGYGGCDVRRLVPPGAGAGSRSTAATGPFRSLGCLRSGGASAFARTARPPRNFNTKAG